MIKIVIRSISLDKSKYIKEHHKSRDTNLL